MKHFMNIVLKSLAAALEPSENYRVLRRLEGRGQFTRETPANPFVGIILDTETTGMMPRADEVIEFGMLKFL
jgi:DNA polymerase-3 subunit epsilon